MDSNFKVKISADLTELEASLKSVQSLMGKVGTNAQASGKVIKESTEKATVAVSTLNKTFQETNDKSGRARLAAFAFGQVIRDAGFFSQSFGLGLLAISNNIPVLIDQLVLLSGVSAGVGTALSLIGSFITAGLTMWAYSSNAVDKNKQSIDEWRRSLNDTTEAQLRGKQAAMDEVVSLDLLYKAATNVANSSQTRLKAAKQLQEQYPTTLGNLSTEAIMAGKAAAAYEQLKESIISAAMAEAAKDKIVENSSRVLDNKTKVLEAQAAILRLNTQLIKEEAAANKAAASANKYASSVTGGGAAVVDPFIKVRALQEEIANQQKIINNATTDTNILNNRNVSLTAEIEKNTKGYVDRMSDGKAAKGLKDTEEGAKSTKKTLEELTLEANKFAIKMMNIKIKADTEEAVRREVELMNELNAAMDYALAQDPIFVKQQEDAKAAQEQMQATAEWGKYIVQTVGGDLVNAFTVMLETGKLSFGGVMKAIGDMIKKLIAAALAALVLVSILQVLGIGKGLDFKKVFGTLSGLNTGGGGGGGGQTPFAEGGIVSGPTSALVGEYPGARSNPEVIAPLDKLQNMIANTGGGQVSGVLETRISGNDLVILMNKATKNRNSYF